MPFYIRTSDSGYWEAAILNVIFYIYFAPIDNMTLPDTVVSLTIDWELFRCLHSAVSYLDADNSLKQADVSVVKLKLHG